MTEQTFAETTRWQEKSPQEGLGDLLRFLISTEKGEFKQELDKPERKNQIASDLIALEQYLFGSVSRLGETSREMQVESLADLDERPACLVPLLEGGGTIRLRLRKIQSGVEIAFVGHGLPSQDEQRQIEDYTLKFNKFCRSLPGFQLQEKGNSTSLISYTSEP